MHQAFVVDFEGCAHGILAAFEVVDSFSDAFGHLEETILDKIRKVFYFQ